MILPCRFLGSGFSAVFIRLHFWSLVTTGTRYRVRLRRFSGFCGECLDCADQLIQIREGGVDVGSYTDAADVFPYYAYGMNLILIEEGSV